MAATGKPNILILWGDDIGWWNISYNNRGQMGYRTPNIDRIGNEGATFTDGVVSTPITGCFANHCDWRLPSIVELQGIFDASAPGCAPDSGQCIDPIFGPAPILD